jgi:dGTPase
MAKAKKLQKKETKSAQIVPMHDDGLAAYAERATRGRLYKEAPSKTRGDFERDRDRIIHSAAFRRLKFKTQVFVYHEGDHYRTRLSHSIEVAQVARSLARLLKVDEDLAETCGLAHDLGHTPFAHVGEDALKECMQPYGGFDHNDQTLRIVTKLEKKYPGFDGLNLTWESLEGLIKHGGPAIKKNEKKKFEITLDELRHQADFKLASYASLEAQIAGLSDDIAYNSHDLDDGLHSGIFTLKDLSDVAWVGAIIKAKQKAYPGIDDYRLSQETIRDVMGTYVIDVLNETKSRLADLKPKSADDIRAAGRAVCAMSDDLRKKDKALRAFLWARFYRSPHVSRLRIKIFKCVQDLFHGFMQNKRCLPLEWQVVMGDVPQGFKEQDWHARVIADYIASMTDRKALMEHRQIFDTYQDMR